MMRLWEFVHVDVHGSEEDQDEVVGVCACGCAW